jgi:hypothetical protein
MSAGRLVVGRDACSSCKLHGMQQPPAASHTASYGSCRAIVGKLLCPPALHTATGGVAGLVWPWQPRMQVVPESGVRLQAQVALVTMSGPGAVVQPAPCKSTTVS